MSDKIEDLDDITGNYDEENGCEAQTVSADEQLALLAGQMRELQIKLDEKTELLSAANSVVETQTAKISELSSALIRERADFDNYRKRTALERERIREDAAADVITKFIPVLDVITQALGMITDEKVAEGVRMIYTQITGLLSAGGVSEIDALGKPFDPTLHNAMMQVKVNNPVQVGIVVEVFQKGYRMGERILRHSVVKVGC